MDTLTDLNLSVNYALKKYSFPLKDKEHTRKAIGDGVATQVMILHCSKTKTYFDSAGY